MRHLVLIFGLAAIALTLSCAGTPSATQQNATAVSTPPPATQPVPASSPRTDIVRTETQIIDVAAGSPVNVPVRLVIAEGFHINANPPSLPHLIPTELKIEPEGGITAGAPVYPSSVTKKFAFAEQPLKVYEGETIIKLPLRVAATATKGTHELRGKLRAQPCDNQACYPPRTIETVIEVNVK